RARRSSSFALSLMLLFTFISPCLTALPAEAKWRNLYHPLSSVHERQRSDSYYSEKQSKDPSSADVPDVSSSTMLKGGVTYCVPKGTPIKMKLATCPTSGLRLMDRDIDGKLHPAYEGQVLTSRVSEDLY